jgi:hypothetical protein
MVRPVSCVLFASVLLAFIRRQAVRCLPAIFSGFFDPLISA